jgi:hypothetical protein
MKNVQHSAWARLTAALVAALLTAQVAFLMFAQVSLAKSKLPASDGELIPGKRWAMAHALHEAGPVWLLDHFLAARLTRWNISRHAPWSCLPEPRSIFACRHASRGSQDEESYPT